MCAYAALDCLSACLAICLPASPVSAAVCFVETEVASLNNGCLCVFCSLHVRLLSIQWFWERGRWRGRVGGAAGGGVKLKFICAKWDCFTNIHRHKCRQFSGTHTYLSHTYVRLLKSIIFFHCLFVVRAFVRGWIVSLIFHLTPLVIFFVNYNLCFIVIINLAIYLMRFVHFMTLAFILMSIEICNAFICMLLSRAIYTI